MDKQKIIDHINEKIRNYEASTHMMQASGMDNLVRYGEGSIDALQSLLHELDEHDWFD